MSTSSTSTLPTVDPPPIGEAYAVAIAAACGEMCPGTGAWIAVSPNHSDYEEALVSISRAYPDVRLVDPDVADGYPWTGDVLNIARVDDRSDPGLVTVRLAFDTDRRNPIPCTDVLLAATGTGTWEPASASDLNDRNPVAKEYDDGGCNRHQAGP